MMGALILAAVALLAPQAAPSADFTPRPLAGVVREKDGGRPVAAAEIWLTEGASPIETPQGSERLRGAGVFNPNRYAPAVLARARSDDQGRFTVVIPAAALACNPVAPLALWAVAAGPAENRSLALSRFFPSHRENELKTPLDLERPTPAEVVVNTPDGRPIAGARVAPTRFRGVLLPNALGDALGAELPGGSIRTLAISRTHRDLWGRYSPDAVPVSRIGRSAASAV